ncbi:hypothetical protein OIO90_001502 [Microbotryomycetes sp. JL221]|nr:hypothetical protein OIO90_001502 [Microbotryomycetes sp. JL221]
MSILQQSVVNGSLFAFELDFVRNSFWLIAGTVYVSSCLFLTCWYLFIVKVFGLNDSRRVKHGLDDHLRQQQAKQRSWILTGIAAFVTSVTSIPFVCDLVFNRFDVGSVKERRPLPTFVLALSMLVPKTRNDVFFNALFFVTRIVWHGVLLVLYWSPYGRTHTFGVLEGVLAPLHTYSLIPAISFSLAAPLHIQWFITSMRGMIKRRNVARRLAMSTMPNTEQSNQSRKDQTTFSSNQQKRPRLMSLASSYLESSRPTLIRMSSALRVTSFDLTATSQAFASSSTYSTGFTPFNKNDNESSRRRMIELQVRQFFTTQVQSTLPLQTQRWLNRDQHDILKAHAVLPITNLRLRAGQRRNELRQLVERRVFNQKVGTA